MVRRSMATIDSPFASNRERTLPTRPRRTASGLRITRVRCVMARTVARWSAALVVGVRRSALALDLAAEEVRRRPEAAEDPSDEEHDRDQQAECQRSDLDRPTHAVRPLEAEQPGGDEAGRGNPEAERQGRPGWYVGQVDEDRRDQSDRDRFEG